MATAVAGDPACLAAVNACHHHPTSSCASAGALKENGGGGRGGGTVAWGGGGGEADPSDVDIARAVCVTTGRILLYRARSAARCCLATNIPLLFFLL